MNINSAGLLLLNKDTGSTSFENVQKIRKIFQLKKAGHSGTLDKFANGLLLIALSSQTKLLKHLVGLDKTYTATIRFGEQRTTDDPYGEIIASSNLEFDIKKIERNLKKYSGVIEQTPPQYSAVHVDGKRAYQLARNSNENIDIKARTITISNIQIIKWDNPELTLKIDCSSGTYIRSIARDIGLETGYHAYLKELTRNRIGSFSLDDSYTIEELKNISNYEDVLLQPNEYLPYKSFELNEIYLKNFINGQPIQSEWFKNIDNLDLFKNENFITIKTNNKFTGIIKYSDNKWKYDIVTPLPIQSKAVAT